MGVKIIPMKKTKLQVDNNIATLNNLISLQSITINTEEGETEDQPSSVYVDEAVKKVISITYDEEGNPSISNENIGMQYDNRVVWLHVDLDNLL